MGAVVAVPLAVGLALLSTSLSSVSYWTKWLISYAYVAACKRFTKERFDLYDMNVDHDPVKVGFLLPEEEIALESPQPESHLSEGSDEVFFYGVNSRSEYFVTRIARACNDEAEAWIYLKLQNGRVYQLKKCSSYQQSCSEKRAFTCGELQLHYIKPMRKWRIFFNGLLREKSDEDPAIDRMVRVKFALLWTASSDVFDFTTDVHTGLLAKAFAKAKWEKALPPLENLRSALNFYAQGGTIMGTVSIDENPDIETYLFGERVRFLGDTSFIKGGEFCHILGQISKNGSIVHIAEASIQNMVERLQFGFMIFPNGILEPITDLRMVAGNCDNAKNEDNEVNACFQADGCLFNIEGDLVGKQSHFESKKGWDGSLTIDCLALKMNSLEGRGVLMKGKILKSTKRNLLKISKPLCSTARPLVVHFSEKICQIPDLTGGKGSSLGKLTHLSKLFQNFVVPNGIVVTTAAYNTFITENILNETKYLEDVLYENVPGDVKEACQRVMNEITKTSVPTDVHQAIVNNLQKAFGQKLHSLKFAIRSSATGEDTEQMSAAGQMETFLGINGLDQIMIALQKCWASQFGFIAVQYKRQNGQILNSPMAVVIQEMVSCDVAGVLFTCDPLTGNPIVISITANYGLGESVVSGSEEPDTIELQRSENDELNIKSRIIGAKGQRIIIKDDGGTGAEKVSETEREVCCISEDMALRLGNLAIKIEKSYRSHRDIEWGIWNNTIYLFQSRPVTSGMGETDYEIDHEQDGPMRIENEYFSVSNVGEVMPGASSPLGAEISMKFSNITFQRKARSSWQSSFHSKYFPRGMVIMCYHGMFYITDFLEKISEGRAIVDAFMIGLFGRVLDDEQLIETAMERFGRRKKDSFFEKNYIMFNTLFAANGALKTAKKIYRDYRIPVEKYKTSEGLFNALMYACSDLCDAMASHLICSQGSSMWNMMLLFLLMKANGELNEDVYGDLSRLLAKISEVESADVPSAMQSLAFHIAMDTDAETFKKMSEEEATDWLKTTSSVAGIKFRAFLDKHGHRCLKEFDMRSKTWSEDPKKLVKLLQNLVGNVSSDSATKKEEDFQKLFSGLKTPLGFIARCILKYILLPQSRSAVQNREASKSILIKGLDCWRKGYWHLAKLMVSEGRIPDEDLLFFITLDELREFLRTRSPKILSRAKHRRRRYPELDRYLYPEIMIGLPKPINMDPTPIVPAADNFMMKGIPVSQGVAKGFVRVALTLEEAAHLQPGEILLTYSTDIGWSPYFPTLAGVVTELGGLISHGAVVSREYGLPCIVGLHGATRKFQTGDYVLLDGNKGILQKISVPQ